MADTSLRARRVVTPHGIVGPAAVEIRDGRIAVVRPAHGSVPDVTLVPGFVDLQVNGVGAVNVASATTDQQWDEIGRAQLSTGTTTWLPTVTTRAIDEYMPILERIQAAADRAAEPWSPLVADIAGVHLEGPFLGERPGAHPTHLIQPVDQRFVASLPPIVKLVTLGADVLPTGACGTFCSGASYSLELTYDIGGIPVTVTESGSFGCVL